MIRILTPCLRLLFVIWLMPCLTSPTMASEQSANGVDLPGETVWCRHVIYVEQFGPKEQADAISARLLLNTSGTASVYLNGQRLVRNHTLDGQTASWNIAPVLRNGLNCLAVAISGQPDDTRLTTKLVVPSPATAKHGAWKQTTASPPVGWQQSTFNDRDWQQSKSQPADLVTDEAIELEWRSETVTSRMAGGQFRFVDGDHVVLLGGTFIERAQSFGYLEATLTAAAAESHVTFRNLGWSADTVFAESRGIFDSPQVGYRRMIEHVRAEEPSVILVCYGQNEAMSFEGGASGLQRFQNQLSVLYRDLASTGAIVVLLSPHPLVAMPAPLPDASRWNSSIEQYTTAVRQVANKHGAPFVDLFSGFEGDLQQTDSLCHRSASQSLTQANHQELYQARQRMWTENGMHWNADGYRVVSTVVNARLCGTPPATADIRIDGVSRTISAAGAEVLDVEWGSEKNQLVAFRCKRHTLSSLPLTIAVNAAANATLTVTAADSRDDKAYKLKALPTAEEAGAKTTTFVDDTLPQFEHLRQLAIRKNELYFHRWRPQNITYLFGFRKHEQGNNASEIAEFDPLVNELDKQIHESKQPQWQTIVVTTTSD